MRFSDRGADMIEELELHTVALEGELEGSGPYFAQPRAFVAVLAANRPAWADSTSGPHGSHTPSRGRGAAERGRL